MPYQETAISKPLLSASEIAAQYLPDRSILVRFMTQDPHTNRLRGNAVFDFDRADEGMREACRNAIMRHQTDKVRYYILNGTKNPSKAIPKVS